MFGDRYTEPELKRNSEKIKGVTEHQGYKMVKKINHKYKTGNGYVKKHRLVMEQSVGRYLSRDEIVHHIDGNKKNNNIDNLMIVTMAEHRAIHNYQDREYKKLYNINEVEKLYLEGNSTREVARILGMGKSTVGAYVRELGIARKNFIKDDKTGRFIKRRDANE